MRKPYSCVALAACSLVASFAAFGRTISIEEIKSDDVVSGHRLTFSSGSKLLGLYRVYGATDCGATTNGWTNFERVAPIPASLDTYVVSIPTGWGSQWFHMRFFLMEEEFDAPYDSRVDYIQSTKAEYILTGVSATADTRFVLKVSNPEAFQGDGNGGMFGASSSDTTRRFNVAAQHCGNWTHGLLWKYGEGANDSPSYSYHFNSKAVVSNLQGKVFWNGKEAYDFTETGNFAGSGELSVFAVRTEGATPSYSYCKMRLYGLKIYEGATLVRNYLPVVTNGVALLYETVNGEFKNNDRGNGLKRFTAGERIPTDVGALTLVSSSDPIVRAEPKADVLVTSSGMSVRLFGKKLYGAGTNNAPVEVHLAYAENGTALPAHTKVWSDWKDNRSTRANVVLPGLEASKTYSYSVYVKCGNERSEAQTGTFTTGKVIYVSPDGDEASAGSQDTAPTTIYHARATAEDGDEIRLLAGTYLPTNTFQCVRHRLALVGQGAMPSDTTLDANFEENKRLFYSQSGYDWIRLSNLTFKNARYTTAMQSAAYYDDSGAAVRLTSTYAISYTASLHHWVDNCVFSACTNTVQYGGALHVEGCAHVENCTFSDCKAGCGGAVFVHCGGEQTSFKNCTFLRNAGGEGGALGSRTYNNPNTAPDDHGFENEYGAVLDTCTFADNVSTSVGGAAMGKIVEAVDCVFRDNTAPKGGAWHGKTENGENSALGFTVELTRCLFTNNTATTRGGALDGSSGRRILACDSLFVDNAAAGNGAALVANGYFSATNSVFRGNRSTTTDAPTDVMTCQGAVVSVERAPSVEGCLFEENVGRCRVGVFKATGANARVTRCVFRRNTIAADDSQSDVQRAIVAFGGTGARLRNSLIACNTNACGYGCGVMTLNTGINVENCTIADNRCNTQGSVLGVGLYVNNTTSATNANNIVTGNRNLRDGTLENFYGYCVDSVCNSLEDGAQLPDGVRGNWAQRDPRFVDAAAGDYSILYASRARDHGKQLDWMTEDAVDLAGKGRINGDMPDIGAYECWLRMPGLQLILR